MIPLTELDLESKSDIEVRFFMGASRIATHLEILLVKYSGVYGHGSAGNGDARHMYAKAEYALAAIEPMAAVLDFTDLSYEWGDMLEMMFHVGRNVYATGGFPVAWVVGPKCAEAIGTLIHDDGQPATSDEIIFDNLEDAWSYVEREIEK